MGAFNGLALSSGGSRIAGCQESGDIYASDDNGAAWKWREAAAQMAEAAVAMDSGLRLRSKPGLKGVVMGRLDKGGRAKVLERGERNAKA
jgi:hypothetical protein